MENGKDMALPIGQVGRQHRGVLKFGGLINHTAKPRPFLLLLPLYERPPLPEQCDGQRFILLFGN